MSQLFALRINCTTKGFNKARFLGIPSKILIRLQYQSRVSVNVLLQHTKLECYQGTWRAYLHVITFQFGMLSAAARSINKFNYIIECIDQIFEWSLVRCFWVIPIYFSSALAVVIYRGIVRPINIFDTFRIHCCRQSFSLYPVI